MYRQGLGDCHLITFDPGGTPIHVLIDCGTLGATTTGVKMPSVANDIATATGHHLHLLIATHEHHDHVSGFRKETPFDGIQVDHVWLAWTEDGDDDLAKGLRKYKQDIHGALRVAAAGAAAAGAGMRRGARAEEPGKDITGLIDLLGMPLAPVKPGPLAAAPLGADKFADTVDLAMEYVRTRKGAHVEYLKPGGTAREESWLPGFRVYVLGPPRDKAELYDLGGHESAELYGLLRGMTAAADFASVGQPFAAYLDQRRDSPAASQFEKQMPFDPRFRRELSVGGTTSDFRGSYDDPGQQWRRIDGDWLDPADELALQLDNATNNTSLALAFERISDGKVLLFPADAQQGSWLSWHKLNLGKKTSGGTVEPVAIRDLLGRTVFYKVGHHASHNATAREKGLELMDATEELVAFIPVDRAVALQRKPKDSWQMPARQLYRRLLERCNGRVVRSDLDWAADSKVKGDPAVEAELAGIAKASEWTAWGKAQRRALDSGQVTINPLYVEYRLD
jgi:hypothetical protein